MRFLFLVLLTTLLVSGQTKPNLGLQGANADFSSFGYTKPVTVVTSLPGTCVLYSMVWLTTAPAGQNLYGCTSTNVWTELSGSSSSTGTVTSVGISLPSLFTCGGPVTTSGTLACTYSLTPGLVGGTNITISGTWPNQTISATTAGGNATSLQGTSISSTSPTTNQFLEYNGTNYTPTTIFSLAAGLGTSVSGTTNLAVNVAMGIRSVGGSSDMLSNSDCGGLVTYTSSSAVSVTIPQAGLSGNFLAGCPVTVRANGAGAVTFTPSTSTINSSAYITVNSGKACLIVSDGTNYQIGACN